MDDLVKLGASVFEIESPYACFPSLRPVATDEIHSCYVALVEVDGKVKRLFRGYSKGHNNVCLYILRSKRDEKCPYVMSLVHGDKFPIDHNFGQFKTEEFLEKGKKPRIKFNLSERDHFTLEFLYRYDYLNVKRIISLKRELLRDIRSVVEVELEKQSHMQGETLRKREVEIVPVRHDLIKNYSKKSKPVKGKKEKWYYSFSPGDSTSRSTPNLEAEVFKEMTSKKCEKWDYSQLEEWFQQIPFVDYAGAKIISLYTELDRNRLMIPLSDFLSEQGSPFVILRREIETAMRNFEKNEQPKQEDSLPETTEPEKKKKKKKKSSKNLNKKKLVLERIVERKDLVTRLSTHFKILKFMNDEYNPSFYILLRKRVLQKLKIPANFRNFADTFHNFEITETLFEQIHSWSPVALRRKLSFSFLYGLSIEDFRERLELKFKEFNKGHESIRYTNLEALEAFNEEILEGQFELENISLKLHLTKQFWQVCEERKVLRKLEKRIKRDFLKKDGESIKKCVEHKHAKNLRNMNALIKTLDQKMQQQPENENERILGKIRILQNSVAKIQRLKSKEIEQMMAKYQDDYDLTKTKREEHDKKIATQRATYASLLEDSKWEYFSIHNGPYFNTMVTLIDQKITERLGLEDMNMLHHLSNDDLSESESEGESDDDEVHKHEKNKKKKYIIEQQQHKKRKVIPITVKLVLSRKLNYNISHWMKTGLKWYKKLSPFKDLDYIKTGFSHAGLILCNIAIQWFGHSIVVAEDLNHLDKVMKGYEDLACIDCQSLEFLRRDQYETFVRQLSGAIIYCNSNFQYSFMGMRSFQSPFVQNCQEFAVGLLTTMGLPWTFYPEVQVFIDSLSNLESKTIIEQPQEEEEDEGEGDDDEEESSEEEEIKKKEKRTSRKVECFRFVKISTKRGLFHEDVMSMCEPASESDADWRKKYFPSHADLDQFVITLQSHDHDLNLSQPGLYQLLKAFDRSFWVMNLTRKVKDDTNDPLRNSHGSCLCPFQEEKEQDKKRPRIYNEVESDTESDDDSDDSDDLDDSDDSDDDDV